MQNYSFSFGALVVISLGAVIFLRPSPNDDILYTADYPPFALVELFTSEGCSSCPPADAVLSQLVAKAADENKAVYALSFHVDYWNYLGWKDPFSDAAYSQRQRAYAAALRSSVYTPQMVVNGQIEFVGSRRSEAVATVANALRQKASVQIELSITEQSKDKLKLKYTLSDIPDNAVIHFALAEGPIKVEVNRGENRGRSLEHDNVVRAFRTEKVGSSKDGEITIVVPKDVRLHSSSVIAYVQEGATGEVLGATGLSLLP